MVHTVAPTHRQDGCLLPHLLRSLLLVTTLGAGLLGSTAHAAESVAMPFAGGQAVRIIQGYNGGTHQGRSQYGLDLVLAGGGTSGAAVVSPADGTVAWAYAPGTRNGCIAIALRGGGHSVMLCHVVLDRAFGRGEAVSQGQRLGTVGPPGTVGNNGTPHVHMELHRGALARSPVPFSPPTGLLLEGLDLPASGRGNEHGTRGSVVSTNGSLTPAAPQRAAAPAERPSPSTRSAVRPLAPAPRELGGRLPPAASCPPARPGAACADGPAPGGVAVSAPAPKAVAARAAVVRGTGSCLRVRAEASLAAAAAGCLPEGTEVALAGGSREADGHRWRRVEGTGWVVAEYLTRTRAVVAGAGDCLNVRERASTDALVVGCMPEGTTVALTGETSSDEHFTWYRVEPSGVEAKDGWVAGEFLE